MWKKFLNRLRYPRRVLRWTFQSISPDVFPDRPVATYRILARLYDVKFESQRQGNDYNLGSLYTLPHPLAVKAYTLLTDQNPANLGSWSDSKQKLTGTKKLEQEVIQKQLQLYGATTQEFDGYVTSGGTEGNLMALWLGRNWLRSISPKADVCLLKTSLTHYSVTKAANICAVREVIVPLLPEMEMDPAALAKNLEKLSQKKITSFLISLTFGYTLTGTSDNLIKIERVIKKHQQQFPNANFYVWIDAAFNGLLEPMISSSWLKKHQTIQAVVVDYHKFGLAPYPASLIIYRKRLKKHIESKIDYLAESDMTISGSRSGLPAASIWAVMHGLGKSGYQQLISHQLRNKEIFINGLKLLSSQIEIITSPHSLTCGLVFKTLPNQRLPQGLEHKYSLYPAHVKLVMASQRKVEKTIYKCFFLPGLKQAIVKEFLADLSQLP